MTANNKSRDPNMPDGSESDPSTVEGRLPVECAAALLYTTFPNKVAAVAAGRTLVEGRHAGCINILPAMTAIYVWGGQTEVADEVVLIAKVPGAHVASAMAAVRKVHPYQTPAILVLPVIAANGDYIDWLRAGVEPAEPPTGPGTT